MSNNTILLLLQHMCLLNQVLCLFLLCSTGSATATTFILSGRKWSLRVMSEVFSHHTVKEDKFSSPNNRCKISWVSTCLGSQEQRRHSWFLVGRTPPQPHWSSPKDCSLCSLKEYMVVLMNYSLKKVVGYIAQERTLAQYVVICRKNGFNVRIPGSFLRKKQFFLRTIDITKLVINIPASLVAHQYYPSILPGPDPSCWLRQYDDEIFPANP